MALTLNQTGLPAGILDRSRSDGLDTGALIQITSSFSASVTLQWRPDDDTTSVLTAINSTHWELTPPAGAYGSYLFKDKITNAKRVFAIRTPNKKLRIPALNESGNISSSLSNNNSSFIADSNFNEASGAFGPFAAGNYGGWYSAWRELIFTVENIRTPADDAASYLVLNTTSSLSNERVFTAGTGIKVNDAGANSTFTVSINDGIVATVSGTKFTGPVQLSNTLIVPTSLTLPGNDLSVIGWMQVVVTGSTYYLPLFQ